MKAREFLVGLSNVAAVSCYRIIFVSSLVLFAAMAAGAQARPCACKAELLNQLYRSNAADSAAQFLQQAMGEHGKRLVSEVLDGPNPKHTNYKELIDGDISDGVNKVKDANAGNLEMKTEGSSCDPTVSASSACLRSLAEKIAPAHKSFCEKKRAGIGGGSLTVDKYLLLLRELYKAEIAEILKAIRALPKECIPQDWIGLLTYNETTMHNITIQDTPTVKEKADDIMTRTGVIRLNGDTRSPSTWEVGGRYNMTKTSNDWKYCTQTDRKNNKRTQYETLYRIRWDNTGSHSGNIEVFISEPDGGSALVSFIVPPINVLQKGETTDILKSGCPNDSINNIIPMNNDVRFDASPVTSDAPYFKGDPEKLSGTDTKIIPSGGTIKITYDLFRIGNPPKK